MSINHKNFSIGIIVAAMFFFAFLKFFEGSPDYIQYESFFELARFDLAQALERRFEPGFRYLSLLLANFFDSNEFVYALFVVFSICLKMRIIKLLSSGIWFYIAAIFIVIRFSPLHEFTQIRASISIGLCFFVFYYFQIERNRSAAIFFSLIAVSFHYSSIIVLPFLYFPVLKRSQAVFLAIFIYFFLFLSSKFLSSFFYEVIFGGEYNPLENQGVKYNLFSPVFFPEYFLIFFGLFFWNGLNELMKKILVLEIMSFSIFYSLSDYQTLAVRAREFFSVFWVFFIAQAYSVSPVLKLFVFKFFLMSIFLGYYLFFYLNFFI